MTLYGAEGRRVEGGADDDDGGADDDDGGAEDEGGGGGTETIVRFTTPSASKMSDSVSSSSEGPRPTSVGRRL
jgi:hypothetical protein